MVTGLGEPASPRGRPAQTAALGLWLSMMGAGSFASCWSSQRPEALASSGVREFALSAVGNVQP